MNSPHFFGHAKARYVQPDFAGIFTMIPGVESCRADVW